MTIKITKTILPALIAIGFLATALVSTAYAATITGSGPTWTDVIEQEIGTYSYNWPSTSTTTAGSVTGYAHDNGAGNGQASTEWRKQVYFDLDDTTLTVDVTGTVDSVSFSSNSGSNAHVVLFPTVYEVGSGGIGQTDVKCNVPTFDEINPGDTVPSTISGKIVCNDLDRFSTYYVNAYVHIRTDSSPTNAWTLAELSDIELDYTIDY